jgi:ribulose-phosphate 3-epimerase
MLSANPAQMGQELMAVVLAGADGIHWDIMDGHFVDAISFGALVIEAHRFLTSLGFGVHLMVQNPQNHIKTFAKAGADFITVHREIDDDLRAVLSSIKSLGLKAGIAFNPATAVDDVLDYCDLLDEVLVMTVLPGRSGQNFMKSQLEKVKWLRSKLPQAIKICVDGGINPDTLRLCLDCGADNCVTGSYLFGSRDYSAAMETLRNVCAENPAVCKSISPVKLPNKNV